MQHPRWFPQRPQANARTNPHYPLSIEFGIIQWGKEDGKRDFIIMDRRLSLFSLSVLASFLFFIPEMISAEEKVTIGTIEEVILLPWRVRLPARVDTGAAKCSLDAQDIKIHGDRVEFKLPRRYGGLKINLPVIEWRHVRTPEGLERRPVVELEICFGSRRIRTLVNLTDRSMVKYPLILGRNFLKGDFVVDVKRRRTTKPDCPDNP